MLCLAILFLFAVGTLQSGDGRPELGDRRFDRPSAADGFVRLRPGSFGVLLYLAVTGASGQAVSLDRFLTRWRQARARAAISRSARHQEGRGSRSAPMGRRCQRRGFCEPGVATDPDSPGLDLCDGRTREASRPIVVDRCGPLEDDGDG